MPFEKIINSFCSGSYYILIFSILGVILSFWAGSKNREASEIKKDTKDLIDKLEDISDFSAKLWLYQPNNIDDPIKEFALSSKLRTFFSEVMIWQKNYSIYTEEKFVRYNRIIFNATSLDQLNSLPRPNQKPPNKTHKYATKYIRFLKEAEKNKLNSTAYLFSRIVSHFKENGT